MTAATDTTPDVADDASARIDVRLPSVNLLPPEVAEHKAFRRLQAGLAGVVVIVALIVGLVFLQVASGMSGAKDRLDAANSQGMRLQKQVSALAYVTKTKEQADAAQAALSKALGQEVRWSDYLHDLSITLPDNVWVTSVTVAGPGSAAASGAVKAPATSSTSSSASSTGAPSTSAGAAAPTLGTVTIVGTARSYNDVAVWLETLAKEKGYTNPYLTQGAHEQIGDQTVVNFTSTVQLTPGVLSNRYTEQAGN